MILPQTEWLQPKQFPDLSKYDEIAIDLETRDPNLKKLKKYFIMQCMTYVGYVN